MIEDYIICYNVSIEDLVKEINTYIPQGYEPYGSPFVAHGDICQVMIKQKDFEEDF